MWIRRRRKRGNMPTIELNGPGMNALGSDMMHWIIEQVEAAAGAPILLKGAGKAFSAGLNLREVHGLDRAGMRQFIGLLERTMATLFNYSGPVVACVNGHAIAGGCVLTLCCDMRIMTDNPRARIGLNEVAVGLRFPPGCMSIVRQRVRRSALSEVVLGAQLMDPIGAVRAGLVDEISDTPEARAREWLDLLGSHDSAAFRATKFDIRDAIELSY